MFHLVEQNGPVISWVWKGSGTYSFCGGHWLRTSMLSNALSISSSTSHRIEDIITSGGRMCSGTSGSAKELVSWCIVDNASALVFREPRLYVMLKRKHEKKRDIPECPCNKIL